MVEVVILVALGFKVPLRRRGNVGDDYGDDGEDGHAGDGG